MGIRLLIGLVGLVVLFLAAYWTSWTIGAVAVVLLCIAVIPRPVERSPGPVDRPRQLR